jgi:hypothetical protein
MMLLKDRPVDFSPGVFGLLEILQARAVYDLRANFVWITLDSLRSPFASRIKAFHLATYRVPSFVLTSLTKPLPIGPSFGALLCTLAVYHQKSQPNCT